jgi:hypothetical protein
VLNLELNRILVKAAIETILERYGCSIKVINFETTEIDIYCPEEICFEEKSKLLDEISYMLESYVESESYDDKFSEEI